MADEEQVEQLSEEKGDSSSQKNPLLTIILLLNAVLLGAVAYFQFSSFSKKKNEPTVKDIISAEMKAYDKQKEEQALSTGEAKDEDGLLFPLEGFTANLAQGDGPRRFIRLNTVLKFNKESKEEEYKAKMPQIRDSIISLLNSKRPQDLLKIEGKNFLKEEIKAAINTFLVEGKVIDIYYVGFQIN